MSQSTRDAQSNDEKLARYTRRNPGAILPRSLNSRPKKHSGMIQGSAGRIFSLPQRSYSPQHRFPKTRDASRVNLPKLNKEYCRQHLTGSRRGVRTYSYAPLQFTTTTRSIPSSQIGRRAKTIEDTMQWLEDPRSATYLFPNSLLDPDGVCLIRLKNQRLIWLALQSNNHVSKPALSPEEVEDAVRSVTQSQSCSGPMRDRQPRVLTLMAKHCGVHPINSLDTFWTQLR